MSKPAEAEIRPPSPFEKTELGFSSWGRYRKLEQVHIVETCDTFSAYFSAFQKMFIQSCFVILFLDAL